MQSGVIVSVSGVRGIIGQGLSPELVSRFAAALGTWARGGRVVVSRDSRPSGLMLAQAATAGLLAVGCEIADIGIAPTPTCGLLVREFNAAAGLMITASHNPSPWNGLKMFGPDGAVLSPALGAEVQQIFAEQQFAYRAWDELGRSLDKRNAYILHQDRVLELVGKLERKNRVLLDANGGAGGPLGMHLLQALGAQVEGLGQLPDGRFEHPPEPIPAHLGDVAKLVSERGPRIGLVLDPDADRLALIDENGRCLSEELTLALAVQFRLAQQSGPVVVNMSTSRVIEDVAAQFGATCHRSAVGEANVVAKMREMNAIIGGEGNGGVIDPRIGWVRDPFIGMAMILHHVNRSDRTLAELADALPQYCIQKDKVELDRIALPAAYERLRQRWPEAKANTVDGLRLDWPDRWLHLRGSNTEPIVRIIAEAPTAAGAGELCARAAELLAPAA